MEKECLLRTRIRSGIARRRAIALLSLGMLLALATPAAAGLRDVDWCAPIVVRPDQRKQEGTTCRQRVSDAQIAVNADIVLLGSHEDMARQRISRPRGLCEAPDEHRAIRRNIAELRRLAGPRRIAFVHLHRFDLLADNQMAARGFEADFLLRTERPWQQVLDFFAKDTSPACQPGGCRWSDARFGNERAPERRLRDWIDAAGGRNAFQHVVYYMLRPSQSDRVYSPLAVLADTRNPRYRAWRVAEAKRAFEEGGYDAISLNQKFHQLQAEGGAWIGSPRGRDVAAIRSVEAVNWTAPPAGYGFPDALQDWISFATELRAAGVPYAVTDFSPFPWFMDWDDPRTPEPEWPKLREAMRRAKIVLIDQGSMTKPAELDAFVADLRAHGVQVMPVRVSCGMKPW